MSPKYLAGQKVDRARFRFPEVTGGWGSHCSVQHWIREFVNWPSPVSSFWKTVKSPQQVLKRVPQFAKYWILQGWWRWAAEEREKRQTWAPAGPEVEMGMGGWDLREGQTRKEMRMREVEPHLRRELVENEWPGWEYSGGGWEGTMLAGTCWLMTSPPGGALALFGKCRKLENKSRPLLLNCPTSSHIMRRKTFKNKSHFWPIRKFDPANTSKSGYLIQFPFCDVKGKLEVTLTL